MKHHTQIYLKAFGYDVDDPTVFVPSEISEEKGIDIHHIVNREDRIENLMMLTRQEHIDFGEIKEATVYLLKIHRKRLEIANIPFSEDWFEFYINKYSFYEKDFSGN